MKRFRAGAVEAVMERFNIPEDVPIESKMVTRQIRSAQTQIEGQNAEIRKNVLKYDEVMNKQRMVIYAERKRVLDGEDMHDQAEHMINDVVADYVRAATSEGYAEDWDLDQLWVGLKRLYPVGVTIDELVEESGGERGTLDQEFVIEELKKDALAAYSAREEELGEEAVRELERQVLLAVIDRKWREHLYEMDYLQEGISLRAYAQRDPVVEYQREGFDMFNQMMEGIKEEAVGFLFNLEVQVEETPTVTVDPTQAVPLPGSQSADESRVEVRAKGLGGNRRPQGLQYTAPTIDGAARLPAPRRSRSSRLPPSASAGLPSCRPGRRTPAHTAPGRPPARPKRATARPGTRPATAAPARSTSAATAPPRRRLIHSAFPGPQALRLRAGPVRGVSPRAAAARGARRTPRVPLRSGGARSPPRRPRGAPGAGPWPRPGRRSSGPPPPRRRPRGARTAAA
nr:hypothetical protein GCM10020092_096780 [Actinoplanes digitatis]